MLEQTKHLTYSDVDSLIQETVKLEELWISENPPSPHPYCHKTMSADTGMKCDLSDVSHEVVVAEKNNSPAKGKVDENEKSTISTDTHSDVAAFPFPPIFCRMTAGKQDKYGSLKLIEQKPKKQKKKVMYDSDDTSDENEECDGNGLIKCEKTRDGDYYEYYVQTQNKDVHTMYLHGRCVLPKGAIFHFTGAADNMKREDLHKELVALGAKIEFIDYQKGSQEGWVRLSYPYEAKIIIKKMIDKKLNIAGADLIFRVLSKKDEKQYHRKVVNAIYELQIKAKGLGRKLKKAGYKYATKYEPDNDRKKDN